jgi:hypothetical protein
MTMKERINWVAIPTAIAATMAIAAAAYSQPVQTPLASPITVTGSSGGSQSSQCGFVPGTPSQVVVVNQPTPLRIQVQSQGQPTLWITGPVNRCVMADKDSGGKIEVPGIWTAGTYSVFVGDLSQASHPYTLSITQGN